MQLGQRKKSSRGKRIQITNKGASGHIAINHGGQLITGSRNLPVSSNTQDVNLRNLASTDEMLLPPSNDDTGAEEQKNTANDT